MELEIPHVNWIDTMYFDAMALYKARSSADSAGLVQGCGISMMGDTTVLH